MKKILITGGTTFVSRYAAEYFVKQNYEVYVLNRNSRPQVKGAKLIEGDRHHLGAVLKSMHFDVVADITAYDAIFFVRILMKPLTGIQIKLLPVQKSGQPVMGRTVFFMLE